MYSRSKYVFISCFGLEKSTTALRSPDPVSSRTVVGKLFLEDLIWRIYLTHVSETWSTLRLSHQDLSCVPHDCRMWSRSYYDNMDFWATIFTEVHKIVYTYNFPRVILTGELHSKDNVRNPARENNSRSKISSELVRK